MTSSHFLPTVGSSIRVRFTPVCNRGLLISFQCAGLQGRTPLCLFVQRVGHSCQQRLVLLLLSKTLPRAKQSFAFHPILNLLTRIFSLHSSWATELSIPLVPAPSRGTKFPTYTCSTLVSKEHLLLARQISIRLQQQSSLFK